MPTDTKICRICLKEKRFPFEFPRNNTYSIGYETRCIECKREHSRQYYQSNLEVCRTNRKNYAQIHKETMNARSRAYAKENREHVYRTAKQWRDLNPEKVKAKAARRRAKEIKNGGSFTALELTALFEKQDGKCYYCGVVLNTYHTDHKQPVSKGGSSNITNISLACPKCNHRKHNKTEEEFFIVLGNKR